MKPKLYNNSRICFIYGFVDILDEVEIADWQKEIEEQKKNTKRLLY